MKRFLLLLVLVTVFANFSVAQLQMPDQDVDYIIHESGVPDITFYNIDINQNPTISLWGLFSMSGQISITPAIYDPEDVNDYDKLLAALEALQKAIRKAQNLSFINAANNHGSASQHFNEISGILKTRHEMASSVIQNMR